MSWKCDICDTYNDEKELVCYVCKEARSEASIREGRKKAREERRLKSENALYRNGYTFLKGMFLAGLLASLVIIAVFVIIKLSRGSIEDVVFNFLYVSGNMGAKLFSEIPSAWNGVLNSTFPSHAHDAMQNIGYVVSKAGACVNSELVNVGTTDQLRGMLEEKLSTAGAVIEGLMDNIGEKLSEAADFIKGVFQKN